VTTEATENEMVVALDKAAFNGIRASACILSEPRAFMQVLDAARRTNEIVEALNRYHEGHITKAELEGIVIGRMVQMMAENQ